MKCTQYQYLLIMAKKHTLKIPFTIIIQNIKYLGIDLMKNPRLRQRSKNTTDVNENLNRRGDTLCF